MTTFTIGKLAQLTKISAVTIRYYEKQQLIPSSMRSSGDHRLYPESVASRLHFIRNAKEVGFTLEEIKELLTLQENKKGSKKQMKNRVLVKLAEIRKKLQSLQSIYQTLENLASSCDGEGSIDECPILKTLGKQWKDVIDKST
jgi:DNA-binding transcriptional MerR regulator